MSSKVNAEILKKGGCVGEFLVNEMEISKETKKAKFNLFYEIEKDFCFKKFI